MGFSHGANGLHYTGNGSENGMKVEAIRARREKETWRESLQARCKEKKPSKFKEKAKEDGLYERRGGRGPVCRHKVRSEFNEALGSN